LIPCQADGTLGTAAPCPRGTCRNGATQPINGKIPGACASDCVAGDKTCLGGGISDCGPGNTWASPVPCPSVPPGPTCTPFVTPEGHPSAICNADCIPGRHRCATATGTTDGGIQDGGTSSEDSIETCAANGTWSTPLACTAGLGCVENAGDAFCQADCLPGTLVCVGATRTIATSPYSGFRAAAKCTTDGRIPTVTCTGPSPAPECCAAGTFCRTNPAGAVSGGVPARFAYGCVKCVPSQNEFGLPDTRCSNAAGTARGTVDVQVCTGADPLTADWGAPTACDNAVDCQDPSTDIFIPTRSDVYCHASSDLNGPETESALESNGGTCDNTPFTGSDYGAPISCPGPAGEAITDCCTAWCGQDRQPFSAYCGPVPPGPPVWETDEGCHTVPGAPDVAPWALLSLMLLVGVIRRRRSA
jgi:MYXO-CTERM domain-containing protein